MELAGRNCSSTVFAAFVSSCIINATYRADYVEVTAFLPNLWMFTGKTFCVLVIEERLAITVKGYFLHTVVLISVIDIRYSTRSTSCYSS